MKNLSERLDLLRREPRAATGAILAGTLAYAEADEVDAIAEALLDTGRPEDVAAVIRHRPRLGETTMARLENGDATVDFGLAAIFAHGDVPAVMQAMHVVRRRGGATFAEAVTARLTAGRSDVVDTAAGTLREITLSVLGRHGRVRPAQAARERLERAIVAGLETWPHHRRDDVLIAAGLAAVRPNATLGAIVSDPQHPWGYLLRNIIDLHSDPLVRANLINWLGVPTLAGPVQRRLHEVCDLRRGTTEAADRLARIRRLADVFRDWHLLRTPSRRAALRQVDRPQRCLPELALAAQCPAALQALLPDLVRALPLPRANRPQWWADMIALPVPTARMNALLHLLARTGDEAGRAVEPFSLDHNQHVATVAARHVLAQRDDADASMDVRAAMSRLRHSAHRSIANQARSLSARCDIDVFREEMCVLQGPQRRAAARMLLVNHRERFIHAMRETLQSDDGAQQLAVLPLVNRLGLIDDCIDAITALLDSANARVVATAVRAMARSSSPIRREALMSALQHPDSRVRANAIEAMEQAGEELDDVLLKPLSDSADNRLRANTLGAGVATKRANAPDAMDALRSMLTDVKPLHRISALWQVKRRRLNACKATVESLAANDEQHEIRIRAKRALRFLDAHRRAPQRDTNTTNAHTAGTAG